MIRSVSRGAFRDSRGPGIPWVGPSLNKLPNPARVLYAVRVLGILKENIAPIYLALSKEEDPASLFIMGNPPHQTSGIKNERKQVQHIYKLQ